MGGKWNADKKAWEVPDGKAAEARKIVAGAPTETRTPGKCAKCKGPVKEPYIVCFGCKQTAAGKCVKCGDTLDDWERRHGVKRCAGCREGGGNYMGGASYRDSHGNFVLGDDD
jgi:hypothetical protein